MQNNYYEKIVDKIVQLSEIYPIFKEELEEQFIMQNKKIIKIKINIPLDYVIGRLHSGHKEGILEFTEEEFKKFKEDPISFIEEEDLLYNLKLIIDDYDVDDWGDPLEVNYEEVINDSK